jgi:hypothetical protein
MPLEHQLKSRSAIWCHKIQDLVWPLRVVIVHLFGHKLAQVGQRAR